MQNNYLGAWILLGLYTEISPITGPLLSNSIVRYWAIHLDTADLATASGAFV